jgi:type IV secretory pathway protease TraF
MMALAAAAIDVHPPRAGKFSKSMPNLWGRFWNFRRVVEDIRGRMAQPFRQLFDRFDDVDFSLGTTVRCIIPGWAHAHRGNKYRGRLFLLIYLALLTGGIVFFGTSLGSILIGLAFATHVASASDALVGRYATVSDRLSFVAVCAACLALVMYVPVGLTISRVAIPIQINRPISVFAEGDVVWYNQSAIVQPNDFVLYTIPNTTLTGTNNHTRYILQNQTISRVVAIEGQRVQVKDGKLYVDDVLNSAAPSPEVFTGLDTGWAVPEGQAFIISQDLIPPGARLNPAEWRRLTLIPRANILGRVFLRTQPLWRFSTSNGFVE